MLKTTKYLRMGWRLWAKALGEKASPNDKESDNVAIIRTFIFLTYLITNVAIVANAVRHWNDNPNTTNEIKENDKRVYRQEWQHMDLGRNP